MRARFLTLAVLSAAPATIAGAQAAPTAYPVRPIPLPDSAEIALAYMMSPHQVLFSNAGPSGRRVGAWHPRLMLYVPGATPAKLGLSDAATGEPIQVSSPGTPQAEVVIKVRRWADGSPVGNRE